MFGLVLVQGVRYVRNLLGVSRVLWVKLHPDVPKRTFQYAYLVTTYLLLRV